MTHSDYDDLPLWSAPFGLALLDTVKMRPGMNVLDIGSGAGFPMLELAARLGGSSMVYGLDPAEEVISVINRKKEARGIVNARILRGVAEEIPFPDKYFELIVSNNGLNNVGDLNRSLAECFRVCDNGAQLVMTMNLPHTMTEFYEILQVVMEENGIADAAARIAGHIASKRKTIEELQEAVIGSGFAIRSIDVDGFRMKYTDGRAFMEHFLIRNAFRGPWNEVVPDELQEKVFTEATTRLDTRARELGELRMQVPFACFDCYKP